MPIDPTTTSEEREINARVARYALDRLTNSGHIYGIAAGTVTVWCIGAMEGWLHLVAPSSSSVSTWTRTRFVLRYASYNVIPSFIWGTQSPTVLVESSTFLKSKIGGDPSQLYYTIGPNNMSARRSVWIHNLCSLRGAVAGTVLLSNVIALTTLWHQARQDYADRIQLGREPPLQTTPLSSGSSNHNDDGRNGRTIRLAGVNSDVTQLSLQRRGVGSLWPIYEDAAQVKDLVTTYASTAIHQKEQGRAAAAAAAVNVSWLPNRPIYWQVNDGSYSKTNSWNGMQIPSSWLYNVNGKKLLYLEADATVGDERAIALRRGYCKTKRPNKKLWSSSSSPTVLPEESSMAVSENDLDLDLKEVAQGFRRLSSLVSTNEPFEVVRVLLVNPTMMIESGGGRQTTVRDTVKELELTDIIVDARTSVLSAILEWLGKHNDSESSHSKTSVFSVIFKWLGNRDNSNDSSNGKRAQQPVILETPSRALFLSIQRELRQYGYNVMDRSDVVVVDHHGDEMPPMLVYGRSGADTVNTIREYLEQGIVQDPSRLCGLLTSHDGMEELEALNRSLVSQQQQQQEDTTLSSSSAAVPSPSCIGCICSSDIHDRALEWVRHQCMEGVTPTKIQEQLDIQVAWANEQ